MEAQIIKNFIETKMENKDLHLNKIRNSKFFLIYSKYYEHLTTILKQMLETIYKLSDGDEGESIADITFLDQQQVDVFVVKIREPNEKVKKTVISTSDKHIVLYNKTDLNQNFEFLYKEIVLKSFQK